jgi:hypothetical protein
MMNSGELGGASRRDFETSLTETRAIDGGVLQELNLGFEEAWRDARDAWCRLGMC